MRVKFIKDYEAKTGTGARLIKAGTVLDLSPEKAQALINAGVAKAVDIEGFTLPLLDEGQELIIAWLTESGRKVYLTESPEVKARHEKQGEAWFTYDELKAIEGISREEVERVIEAKEVFPGADVIERIRKGVKRDEERQGKMGY